MIYATVEELADYTGQVVVDAERLLERASEFIDYVTLNRIDASKPNQLEAAKNATCAQVEYFLSVGEQIEGPLQGVTIGSFQMQFGAGANRITPTYLAPRAQRYLLLAGLLYRGLKS